MGQQGLFDKLFNAEVVIEAIPDAENRNATWKIKINQFTKSTQ